mgnify:CR=1 FL=1
MRTTVDVPDDLLRVAKAQAAERGERLKDLFVRALTHEVRGRKTATSQGRLSRATLPLVGDGGQPEVDITNEDIEAALAGDDAARYVGG